MSSSVQVYTQGAGSAPIAAVAMVPFVTNVAPGSTNVSGPFGPFKVGQEWVNTLTGSVYILTALAASAGAIAATWTLMGTAAGTISTLTGDSGGAISPSTGNINLLGTASQITTTGAGSTITWSIPAAFIAPGSIASTTTITSGTAMVATTTVTAGTGITSTTGNIAATAGAVTAGTSVSATTTVTGGTGVTATTGNVTATSGNLVAVAAATGLVLPVATGTGAASGAVTCNGRVGSVTFTGVSIAAAADLTLTMTNSSITGASTRCIWSMSGATTGSGLSIKSYTPSASSVAWVVTNGTGLTTTTANITFDFIVLN